MENKMIQVSGHNSTNIQVAGNLTIGMTLEEAEQMLCRFYEDNVLKLSKEAANIALTRIQELNKDILH